MRVLVTAGNTLAPIDRVRCLTNIFTGRTGARIALCAYERGHHVELITSRPEAVAELSSHLVLAAGRWQVRTYRTFEDLHVVLKSGVGDGQPDVVIHCAAVSDYRVDGVYAPAHNTHFQPQSHQWVQSEGRPPALVDRAAGKIKSDEPELWLRLVRTAKLIDCIRASWGFTGILVKFKLEVGISDEQLVEIAEQSRRQSAADLMVANTLEGTETHAYLGPIAGKYLRVSREELPVRLMDTVEELRAHV
jgi:phosphopantothenoylcysteine synthetase/decarboxylase